MPSLLLSSGGFSRNKPHELLQPQQPFQRCPDLDQRPPPHRKRRLLPHGLCPTAEAVWLPHGCCRVPAAPRGRPFGCCRVAAASWLLPHVCCTCQCPTAEAAQLLPHGPGRSAADTRPAAVPNLRPLGWWHPAAAPHLWPLGCCHMAAAARLLPHVRGRTAGAARLLAPSYCPPARSCVALR